MKTVGELLDTSLTHFEKRDYRQSEEALDQILTSNPDFHRAWFLKGVICEETGRQAEAEQFFQKGGNTYTMWFRLALQLQEKDPARALPYYDRVLQGDRYSNQAWFNKGLLYERLGRQAEAGNCFRSISPFKEILSRIIIPVGFMCFLVGAGITMVRRAEKTMSLLVFAAAAFCFFWMKRDAGLALEMFLKKKAYKQPTL